LKRIYWSSDVIFAVWEKPKPSLRFCRKQFDGAWLSI
jgi:hypothetical protein